MIRRYGAPNRYIELPKSKFSPDTANGGRGEEGDTQDDVDIAGIRVDKNFSSHGKCKFVISRVSPMKLGRLLRT